ncbi:MAG: peptidoglycan D,D-transpeptidase FtsI family protein [Nostocoides sp.]
MNQPVRRLSLVVAFLFACLFVSTTLIQFFEANAINARPDNRRTLLSSYGRERGQILVGGQAMAKSAASSDEYKWQRSYPGGETYAHVTGYYSFIYGAGGGLERVENALLSGASDKLFYRRIADLFTGKKPTGASLDLTLNPAAQKAAVAALGNQRGAVVALDPHTGAILAMVSNPSYNPNALASHDPKKQEAAWTKLNDDKATPMLNRSINQLYPPGSTFKLVVTAAALSSGSWNPESELPGPAVLDLPQTSVGLPNHGKVPCSATGTITLADALRTSCNPAFGYLGMQLGDGAVGDQAAKFGFGDALSVPLRVSTSIWPANLNQPQLAQASIGQYDVRATPLQVAMISAAIANDGVVMQPYLIAKAIADDELTVVDRARPEQLSRAVSGSVAAELTTMMESVVSNGTGTAAQIPGVSVAGKTGTAEHAAGKAPHAWFTGFAPAEDPRVAVAVVVEDGGNAGNEAAGGSVAGPIAKAVMEAVLKR